MSFPVTLNGRTYTLADFEGTNYVDGFPDALEDFVTQAGDVYNSTSTSSVAIGTGSKTFTIADSGKPYQEGTPLRIADAEAPSSNFMDCIVTSYSGTTLVVDVFGFAGSGTKSSWTINIGGAKTVDGVLGISQGGTGATTQAAAQSALFPGIDDNASSTSLTIDSSGNVGISEVSPSEKLHVDGGNLFVQAAGSQIIATGSAGSATNPHYTFGGQTETTGMFLPASNQLAFTTFGTERMRIDSSGNLLVGTTATGISAEGFKYLTSTGITRLVNSGVQTLEVARTEAGGGTQVIFYTNGSSVGTISSTGAATSYNTSSDVRLKENIVDAPSASATIDAIQIRSFDWKVDGTHQKYGVIAQELVTVAPEAVTQGETEGDTWGVDYSKLVPMLVKEIQELRARVAQLEANDAN